MGTSIATKISTIIGCILLIVMALFHGSGIYYATDLIEKSNSASLIKEIFPVLFVHPSIQLLGLAALGLLTLFMKHEARKVLFFIAIMVVLDSLIAFYLGATLPGILLVISSSCFGLGGVKN